MAMFSWLLRLALAALAVTLPVIAQTGSGSQISGSTPAPAASQTQARPRAGRPAVLT